VGPGEQAGVTPRGQVAAVLYNDEHVEIRVDTQQVHLYQLAHCDCPHGTVRIPLQTKKGADPIQYSFYTPGRVADCHTRLPQFPRLQITPGDQIRIGHDR
jgi:hypothetical protein